MPDPMVTCQKKYGAQFCSAMKLACYEITKVAIVKKPSGSVVILPRVVAACITSESWLARCYAQYGSEQCIEWRQTCRGKGLMIMDGDLTAEEQECMESLLLVLFCDICGVIWGVF
ncbi:unnamed protein product [Anisakis simplex]|uniref:Transmembrane protein n=1 Tax=Anisakis simplex TaxID=6269 RepID=A0A0M3JHG1_ANISI|nr:unnamed protein product [Anisakis simplex]